MLQIDPQIDPDTAHGRYGSRSSQSYSGASSHFVHTDPANEDRKYRQSTYEDRQVAKNEVEDLKNLMIRRAGNEN
jgi:hypothetical protein